VKRVAKDVHILIIDDELVMRESLSDWLMEDGFEVVAVESGEEGINEFCRSEWDVLLVDLKMPGMDGLEVLRRVKRLNPDVPVIIMTAYATVDTAVKAMREGAYDYVVKPFNPEEIEITIRKIIAHRDLVRENIFLRDELKRRYRFENLIGKSKQMQDVFNLVRTVAKSNSTVLIQGESGTGKELIARAIHSRSPRSKGPFVVASCGAMPDTLVESELFGYEKGAFTGATAQKKGRFELAHNGTLFLDEVGEISLKTQVDLLRVLQEREFVRVGGREPIAVDVRVVAATNRDLVEAIREGTFREDLYYRLNVVSITLPPLRERKEDIPLLTEHFLKKYAIANRKHIDRISEGAMERLLQYPWPGNVRELENAVERAVVVAKGEAIVPDNLPSLLREGMDMARELTSVGRTLEEVEREYIEKVLDQTEWNVTQAAAMLGIDRSTLYNKIKKFELSRSVEK
jgi:two-component system response regulator AtoC